MIPPEVQAQIDEGFAAVDELYLARADLVGLLVFRAFQLGARPADLHSWLWTPPGGQVCIGCGHVVTEPCGADDCPVGLDL